MKNVKKLFFTTIALTLTSFVMKTVAVWFNVYLTGKIGSAGIGLFQLILSVYALAKTMATAGMNLASTRLCIDDYSHHRHSMRRLLFSAFLIGLFSLILLFGFSNFFAAHWIDNEISAQPLKILSLALPFIALSASLNGYMTAARKMSRYSLIQLCEQIIRIVITVLLIGLVGVQNSKRALCVICAGITASEVFSFSLSLLCYLWDLKQNRPGIAGKPGFLKRMLRIAVPDALGAYIRSALNTIEHLLIPKGIKKSGVSSEKALASYGAVQGMALPIVLYPSSILGVLSGLLVPEIAECKIKKNEIEIQYIINRVLHLAMIFSLICMQVLFLMAKEFSFAIYHSDEAALFIKVIAPLIPIMYLDMTTDGMLKGLDQQLTIMKINVLDSVLCVVLVYFLVPKMAVTGYIITIYVAEIINFLLSFRKLCKETSLRFSVFKNLVFPLLSSFAAVSLSRCFLTLTERPTLNLVLAVGIGLIFYYVFLRVTGSISREDSRWFRGLIMP